MMTREWPFVGRSDELRRFGELLSDGELRGLVLAGAPGVGKTRLALECLKVAENAGVAAIRTTATRAASTVPLGAFTPLLPGNGHAPGAVDDRSDLLHRSLSALVEQAGGRRLVVLVDDADLLDDVSASLVYHLAMARAAFVLATVRTGQRAPDAVVSLWKDGMAQRIEVANLGKDSVDALLAAALEGPMDDAAMAEFAVRSQGNVLFLRELVVGALQDDTLVKDEGTWHLRGALEPSSRLIELIESRLDDHAPAERALLEVVAFGEPLGETDLAVFGDLDVVENLERRGLLVSRISGRRLEIRLAHPIYSEVLRARTPAVRRRTIVRTLADLVEVAGARRRDDVLRVASWRLVGGGGSPATMLAGATAARWCYDFPLAERLARAALDAGAGFEAGLLAAQAAGLQGRSEDAERELAALAPQAADDGQRGAVALARFHNSVLWTGHDRLRILDEAERAIADPAVRDLLEAERLPLLTLAAGPRATVEAAMPLIERAQGKVLALACLAAAAALGRIGRLEEALEVSARGEAAQLATPEPMTWYPWWHVLARCFALNYAGRFEESEALATQQYHQALAERSVEAQALFAMLPGWALAERGRIETTAPRVRESLALHQKLRRPHLVQRGHLFAAMTSALGGRADKAAESLSALDALGLPVTWLQGELLQARAWVAAASGELRDAHRHLEEAVALSDEIGDRVGAASALHGLARLGRAEEVHRDLAAVAAGIEGRLAPARVVHTDALARRDAAGLESVSLEFEAMGADLLAAEAAADAAVTRRRAGERQLALADERRASLLAERCEGAVTPALQAVEVRARLTAAERETALLAAAGRSNKQIADELYLSIRTVENRLHHVYEKLGIHRRSDLPEALDLHHG